MTSRVDQRALQFNQVSIITLLVLAFLVDQPWMVTLTAAVMMVGSLWPEAGLFKQIYGRVLKPAGLLKPLAVADDPRPHLFAQGVGALFLLGASLAFSSGLPLLGWSLTVTVVLLAAVNLFWGFCLGCFLYYQLARRGITADLPQWKPVRIPNSERPKR